jgi:hypothetical protein
MMSRIAGVQAMSSIWNSCLGRHLAPLIFLSLGVATAALAQSPQTDQQIATMIVKASRDAYYRTGHPCACPEDLARNGSRCGKRSAYSRPGGAEPYCYVTDVSKEKIEAYRAVAH